MTELFVSSKKNYFDSATTELAVAAAQKIFLEETLALSVHAALA